MKIIEIIGGLGNQMFQHAFKISLEKKFPMDDCRSYLGRFSETSDNTGYQLENVFGIKSKTIDKTFIEKTFNFTPSRFERAIRKFYPCLHGFYLEKKYRYESAATFPYPQHHIYYRGLWQDSQYFNHISQDIRTAFQFQTDESPRGYFDVPQKHNLVGIHIRRGDYISNPTYNALLGSICTEKYYKSAISCIESLITNPGFIVFTDDPDWAKQNCTYLEDRQAVFVTGNTGDSSHIDMAIMARCDHNIIANSTFSWWGAWLNSNPKKIVIAPNKWFKNNPRLEDNRIIPSSWIQVDTE